MKYAPTESELNTFSTMSEDERFLYCLTRIVEAEEVWGLAEDQGWIMSEINDQSVLPIWPYKSIASISKRSAWETTEPQAISLEYFVYQTSQLLIDNQIGVEVAPTLDQPGRIVEPKEFFNTLENLMESGEYFMEG